MPVGVDVVERQARVGEGVELGRDLGGQAAPEAGAGRQLEADARHVVPERAVALDQAAQPLGRQQRLGVGQRQMQADAQVRQAAGARDGVLDRGTADHQAGGGQDALGVRALDGLVDLGREPEVVRRDDQALQVTARRSRRNWKNSTPSRSRRFSISGLRAISPTIEAILGARK